MNRWIKVEDKTGKKKSYETSNLYINVFFKCLVFFVKMANIKKKS